MYNDHIHKSESKLCQTKLVVFQTAWKESLPKRKAFTAARSGYLSNQTEDKKVDSYLVQ